MERLEDSIIDRMEKALNRLHSINQYLDHGSVTSSGKKNLAKAIIEYSTLSGMCEDVIQKERLEEKYKEIIEEYGLK